MRFNVLALSLTSGLLWGAAILIVASAHAIWPSYGGAFLDLASSIYSGYDPSPGIGSITASFWPQPVLASASATQTSMV